MSKIIVVHDAHGPNRKVLSEHDNAKDAIENRKVLVTKGWHHSELEIANANPMETGNEKGEASR
jgi:hypothetical protein